jgi:putative ABC transport system ATP-binding protein
MILNAQGLAKAFQQGSTTIHAVQDVSITLSQKETLAIVGSSGSGKTTLLSMLAGLEQPSSGEITIYNSSITSMSEKELSRFRSENIGIIFQQFHLMPHLTAEENVMLPLEITGTPDPEKNAAEALESVGLLDRKDHLPHQLSGGENQRVAIARAFVVKPKILFADEPSGNLDTATGEKVMNLLFDLVEESSMTLVLVTHDMNLAQRCKRQIQMVGGHIR